MHKTKVLHIIKSLGRGGAEMLLPETLKLHDRERFEFHYIYFLPWKDQMVQALEENGGMVSCFKAADNIRLLAKYKEVIRYCHAHKIDLIHCHLPWAGFLGRLVHRKTRIPVLYTEHNMQERYHWVTRIINKWSFNIQHLAFGVSEDVSSSIRKHIQPSIPVRTLLNGVNTDTFVRQGNREIKEGLGIPPQTIVVGNLAVFRFQKRLMEWLQAFKKLRDNNRGVHGILVGAGPLEEEIKNEVRRLGLEDHVRLPGLQTEVKPYLEAMDIFMMSSSFEGLPIALLEAMSMECAVVATDAGGIKEVIRNRKDGLTCGVDSWQELPDLVQELIDNPELLRKFKTAARDRVCQSFSLQKMVEELEKYYLEEKIHPVLEVVH